MKYRVKLKSTVTAWVDVELDDKTLQQFAEYDDDPRYQAADDGRILNSGPFRDFLDMAVEHAPGGMDVEYGPIELAHEELDESVEAIA